MMKLGVITTLLLVIFAASCRAQNQVEFTTSPLGTTAFAGNDVLLSCEAQKTGGGDDVDIIWTSSSSGTSAVIDDSSDARFNFATVTTTGAAKSNFSIDSVQVSDTGTYKCYASNDPTRGSSPLSEPTKWAVATASLQIYASVTINQTADRNLTEREDLVLSCQVSNPGSQLEVATVSWTKNGQAVTDDGSKAQPNYDLKVSTASGTDGGIYTCTVTFNVIGTSATVTDSRDITVYSPPKITSKFRKSVKYQEGETVTLKCTAEGYPVPTVKWLKDGEELVNMSARMSYFVDDDGAANIRIKNLEMNDRATYVCSAENSQGTDTLEVLLRVKDRLAALWPFLGILAEVIILVCIIFYFEKRKTDSEPSMDEDDDDAPVKKKPSTATNEKGVEKDESDVRLRNVNA